MELTSKGKLLQKLSVTRRGKKRKKVNKGVLENLSVLGTNANGLKAKKQSLLNTMKHFEYPSIVLIQETKLRQKGQIKLDQYGYEIFESPRAGMGGGLLTAVRYELNPVVVYDSEDGSEILVVQIEVGDLRIRVFNAYGPQVRTLTDPAKLNFWQTMEQEIIAAIEANCEIVIELDANAKVGPQVIPGDPNVQSDNGKILIDLLARHNLFLVNSSALCSGLITRQRCAAGRVERSVLDYVIVSESLNSYVKEMIIDDQRSHVLTKYASTKGNKKKSESDHNILVAKFQLQIRKSLKNQRKEYFNFKDVESQAKFFNATNCVQKYRDKLQSEDVDEYSKTFLNMMDKSFHKCFRKIRVKESQKDIDFVSKYLEVKTQLKLKWNMCTDRSEKALIESQIEIVANYLSEKCAEKNKNIVMGHIEQLKNPNGSLSQNGMWKLKSKLCNKNNEVPHAKVGLDGQLVTAPEKLKDLYLVTYKDRLRHRKIDTKYEDIYILKSNLWNYLLNECLQKNL